MSVVAFPLLELDRAQAMTDPFVDLAKIFEESSFARSTSPALRAALIAARKALSDVSDELSSKLAPLLAGKGVASVVGDGSATLAPGSHGSVRSRVGREKG